MQNQKIRNSNIEILRFVLMSAILLWHVFMHGYGFKSIGTEGFVYQENMPLSLFLATLLSPATYCFVFISGFFGIHFKLSKLFQIIIWCVFVSVIQTGIQVFYWGEYVGAKDLIHALCPITSERWWFMTAFVQLYILSPILNYWTKNVAKKEFRLILTCVFFLSFLHIVTGSYNAGSSLLGLIFVYLLGRYFKKYGCCDSRKSRKFYLGSFEGLFALLLSVYLAMVISGNDKGLKIIMYLLGFINPLIVIMAVCIFFIIYQMPAWKNKYVNKIISANLFIYLFTEGIRGGQIYTFLGNKFHENMLVGVSYFFLALIACILGGLIIVKISNFILVAAKSIHKKIMFSD